MAYYVERHYNSNAGCTVPGYWTPDGPQRMPCDTKEEAEKLEEDHGDEWEAGFDGQ